MRKTLFLLLIFAAQSVFAQLSPSATWAAHAPTEYQVFPNLTYLTASNYDVKLDIYQRRGQNTPQPTIIFMHGGFWAAGTKEALCDMLRRRRRLITSMSIGSWLRANRPAAI
jgi:acetyl esterase/lipase